LVIHAGRLLYFDRQIDRMMAVLPSPALAAPTARIDLEAHDDETALSLAETGEVATADRSEGDR
jgi:hypothetical protein